MYIGLFEQTVFLGEGFEAGGHNFFHHIGRLARILFFENGSFTCQHILRHRSDVEGNRVGRCNMHRQQTAKASDLVLAASAFESNQHTNLAHAGGGLVMNVRCHDAVSYCQASRAAHCHVFTNGRDHLSDVSRHFMFRSRIRHGFQRFR